MEKEDNKRYDILNYWFDDGQIYVDYLVCNDYTNEIAHSCVYLNKNEIDSTEKNNIEMQLENYLKKLKVDEFNLPKTSELNDVTYNIYKDLCDSDNNMIYIVGKEDFDFYNIDDDNYKLLLNDINKYNLTNYFDISKDEIVVYGGLMCCFNDDFKLYKCNFER